MVLQAKDSDLLEESCLISHMNKGGLLYPYQPLRNLVSAMEDASTLLLQLQQAEV